jgi:hypothetical protein
VAYVADFRTRMFDFRAAVYFYVNSYKNRATKIPLVKFRMEMAYVIMYLSIFRSFNSISTIIPNETELNQIKIFASIEISVQKM